VLAREQRLALLQQREGGFVAAHGHVEDAAAPSRKRSCRSTPTRAALGMETSPSEDGSSPARIFNSVVLPAPLAPTRP
jgi:hypothetical protein